MRRQALIKKIILISLAVIILGVGGLSIYVSQMDWNAHKGRLAEEMSAIIGKNIQFSGNLTVSIFPQPRMSAADVQVINSQTGEKLAVIKQLETAVTLSSLLKGAPDIQSLSMDGVEAWFKFNDNGVSSWHQSSKSDLFVSDNGFNLHGFNIQKSIIHFSNTKYDVSFDVVNFNADVQLGGINGPYRLDGNFVKDGDRYGIALGLDGLSQLEDVGISAVITHPKTESYLRYDGSYNASVEGVKGDISGSSKKVADFVNSVLNNEVLQPEYNKPLMFSSSVVSDNAETKFSRLVIKYDSFFEGSGDVVIPVVAKDDKKVVDVKYQLVSLNLLPIKNLLLEQFLEFKKGKKFEPDTKFDLAYDISSERIVLNDSPTGFLENVSAKGTWKDNIFNLDEFYATGSGNMVLNMKGSLLEKESEPQYFVNVLLNGQNFLSFVNALGMKLKSPRQSSYRDVNLSFDIYGNSQTLNIDNINLKMDKSEFDAGIVVDLVNNEYVVNVSGDVFNLDNYVQPLDTEEDKSLSDVINAELSRLNWFRDNKTEVFVKAKSVTYRNILANNVELDFITDGEGMVVVNKAAADNLLSSDVVVSGILRNFGSNSPQFLDVSFDILSTNIKTIADKLQLDLPKWPIFEKNNFIISGVMTGDWQKVGIAAQSKVGTHLLKYDGVLDYSDGKVNFDGDILIKTGQLESLLKLLIGNISGNVYRGPLIAQAYVQGNRKVWSLKDADIQMGIDKYRADAEVKSGSKTYSVKGDVSTNMLNLLNWVNVQKTKNVLKTNSSDGDTFLVKPSFGGDVINYNGYKDVELDIKLTAEKSTYKDYVMNNLSVHLINDQGVMQFQDLKYDNNNHQVSGALQISYSQTSQMSGKLSVIYPDIIGLGGSIYSLDAKNIAMDIDFDTNATTVADMINALSGKAIISGDSLIFKGVDLETIYKDLSNREYSKGLYQIVNDNMQRGKTEFDSFNIEVQFNNGNAVVSPIVLKNSMENVDISGSINLKEWKINQKFRVKYTNLQDIPAFSFTFSGMMNKPIVEISIEDIAKKYDEHWKKIEEQEKAQQDAFRKVQEEKISAVEKLISEVAETSTPVLRIAEDYLSKDFDDTSKDFYRNKIEELNNINTQLDSIEAKITGIINDEELSGYTSEAEQYRQQISDISSEINDYYVQDIERRKIQLFEEENSSYVQIDSLSAEYERLIAENENLLNQYNSMEFFINNEELINQRETIGNDISLADKFHAQFDDINNKYLESDNWDEKYGYLALMQEYLNQERDVYPRMQEIHHQTEVLLLNLVEERRLVFEAEQRRAEEERKKQAEIDAQNLLLAETPAEEPVNSSDIISEDGSNTDDNDEQRSVEMSKGKIITQYDKKSAKEPDKKESSGLLTPVQGEIQKATGTIKAK